MGTEERNKALTLRGFEEMFNKGDLSVVDELVAQRGEDHQEAPETDFATHLKDVIKKMRAAFPDLRFEVHHMVAEGDMVAARSTMTGTHEGRFEIGPFRDTKSRQGGTSSGSTCISSVGSTARTRTCGTSWTRPA